MTIILRRSIKPRKCEMSEIQKHRTATLSSRRPVMNSLSSYLKLAVVISADSFAVKRAPHQFEPGPPGLIGVLATPEAV
jgi:hypothetical protein